MAILDALTELAQLLGTQLDRTPAVLAAHGGSESYFPVVLPDAVAYPGSTADVAQIVAICARHRCPVVGWGAGTSLEGQAQATKGGVVVDFSRMAAVLEINTDNMFARVQPGLTREALNTQLRDTGLFFPVDPGANASLGGMASTRASGTAAVRYGTMRDAVMALEVVLADGQIIQTGTQARKSSAGYDLTALFVGSEGTLGLITELTLRLSAVPEAISAAVCAFAGVQGAVVTAMELIQSAIPCARIELVDRATVMAVNAQSGLNLPDMPHLLLEFHGTAAAIGTEIEVFRAIAEDNGGRCFQTATATEDRNRIWAARHKAYWSILASRPGTKAIVTDVCVPISRLADAILETQADIDATGVTAPILGHVGDGNFHAILMIDPLNEAEMRVAKALSHRMAERALRMGGTITGEHGIGVGKLSLMAAEHGAAVATMAAIKRAMDPDGILNPGKMVPAD